MNSKGIAVLPVILVGLVALGTMIMGANSLNPFAKAQPTTILETQTNSTQLAASANSDLYGVNTGILVTEEPYFDSALSQAGSLGVGWIRLSNDWIDLEPTDNKWNFSTSDKYINTAISKGLKVLYMFDPDLNGKFCSMSPYDVSLGKTKCSDTQFKDCIKKIVLRYKGKVLYYELGNEPDLRRTWSQDPNEYARALSLAYSTLKSADHNAKLLLGGLALGGGQNSDPLYPQKLIAVGALNNFDIMNYHTYDKKDGITAQYAKVRAAVGSKPIWITEVGYPSDPAHQQLYRPGYPYPAGEDGQSAYLTDILPHILGLGVEKVFWYTLVDVPRDNSAFCSYGLVYISGKQCIGPAAGRTTGGILIPKKAFESYKNLILTP